MSATHAHHPPFPQVEASRPSWDSNREVVYSKTHSPDWVPGQGAKTEPADSKNSQSDVHRLDPAELPPGLAYKLIINGVVPRPIAFLSTQDADGHRNLAPYSFFNAVSTDPPVVAISVIGQKNSYCNIAQTKRFVVNVISEHFIEAANYTSIDAPSDVDEWALSGLTPVASSWTEGPAPPRVKESLYALECELYDVVHFHSDRDPGHVTANLVLGRVTAFMIQKDALNPDHTIDLEKLRPVGRAGGITYTRALDAFEIPRPVWEREKERDVVRDALQDAQK